MTRSRQSAKAAGSSFERLVADYLAAHVDDRVDRRVKHGAKDRGDIANLRDSHGNRIVIECKNTARMELAGWAAEAEIERGNDDAFMAAIVHKRHGKGAPEHQWVTMRLEEFVSLLTGDRDHVKDA